MAIPIPQSRLRPPPRPAEELRASMAPPRPDRSLFTDGVDLALAGIVLVVPFVMGGRIVAGECLLVALAVLAAFCWSFHRLLVRPEPGWRWSGAEWLFLGGAALLTLQVVPLDHGLISTLSPRLYELLPIWSPQRADTVPLETWSTLSLYPAATRQGMILLGAYALIFFTTVQRLNQATDVERLLKWVGLAATAMALFGLVQFFAGNGKFFWFYAHPQTTTSDFVKGAFSNRNHFAQFLALGIGPLLWLILRSFSARSHYRSSSGVEFVAGLAAIGLGCVVFAGLLSLSRGGALALFAAVAIGMFGFWRVSVLNLRVLFGIGCIALFIGVGLFLHGQESVSGRIQELLSGDLKKLDHKDGRFDLWQTVWRAGRDFSLLGGGVGTHRELYPAYQQVHSDVEFSHAENGYLQLFEETGVSGLGLMVLGLLLCVGWVIRGIRSGDVLLGGCAAAIGASLAASALHSLMDFVWYVPGIIGVLCVLAGSVCRIAGLARERLQPNSGSLRIPRLAWILVIGAVGAGGASSSTDLMARLQAEPHWRAYQRLATKPHPDVDPDAALEPVDPKRLAQVLQEIVKIYPQDARAHSRLARTYLAQFHKAQAKSENAMGIEQLREAVESSKFASVEELDAWLERSVGRPRQFLDLAYRHTLSSLKLCPLQGECYFQLAQLRFLKAPQGEELKAYWDQGIRLRPLDGSLLLAAGREAFTQGDFDAAFDFWKRAFSCGLAPRKRLIDMLAGQLTAAQFLKVFSPDLDTSLQVMKKYQAANQPAEVVVILKYAGKLAEQTAKKSQGTVAAHAWLGAHNIYRELKLPKRAKACLNQALQADSGDYDVRFACGQAALLRQDLNAAEEHFRWCAERKPTDATLQEMVKQVSAKTSATRRAEAVADLPDSPRTTRRRRQ